MRPFHLLALLCAALTATALAQTTPAPSPLTWPTPTSENRPWTRWWWLGNAVDAPNLTRQLEQFHAAGIGGVEICPIYGTIGAESRYLDFLSPKWTDMLALTCRETKRLGMGTDLTTGTGWPFGGNMVPDANASQGLSLRSFDRLPRTTELPRGKPVCIMAYPPNQAPTNITDPLLNGANFRPFPEGTKFIAAVQTGPLQKVKRAAPGAEGNVLDPYSVSALDQYLAVFDKALKNFPDAKPRAQFHDSFEYYNAAFTPDFFDEFQKRRGYDLRLHLAELNNQALGGAVGGDKDTIARVKCDYRETLSDLHLAYLNRWVQWSHEHGGLARNQAHGGPGNLLDVYANADIPECEIYHLYDESQLPFLKLASSAAHLTGKPLASCESFTWLDEHFNASLAEVKKEADFIFLAGVNHIFLHGIPYSPDDAAWPGWNFYAAVNFGPNGGLWRDFPAFSAYVTRVQSILQANKPANDVLLYVPWHEFFSDPKDNNKLMVQFTTPGDWMKPYPVYEVATALQKSGYQFDEFSDALLQKAAVKDGKIELGGSLYNTIIIPATEIMPLPTMQKLLALAKDGAKIHFLGGLPTDVPGLSSLANRRAELKTLADSLKFNRSDFEYSVADMGKGQILIHSSKAHFPTAGLAERMINNGLRCIRRQRPDGYDYFIVNPSKTAFDDWIPLAVHAQSAILLDPLSDNRAGLAKFRDTKGQGAGWCDVYLQLAPGQSTILRTFTDRTPEAPAWSYTKPDNTPIPVVGTWSVSFADGGPVLPKPFTIAADTTGKLAPWTAQTDPDAQRFAGTAKYTLDFASPPPTRGSPSAGYRLDFGSVADSARITLNGKPLATLWSAPFTLDLGDAFKGGSNHLEIEITNVAANRIRDMDQRGIKWKIFKDINVVNVDYKLLDASKWPLRPAGLLGPIQLIPLSTTNPQ